MGRDNERLKKRGWHAEIPFEIATPAFGGLAMTAGLNCYCEERSDEAISFINPKSL
jgi:hypothetical protein